MSDYISNLPIPLIIMGIVAILLFLLIVFRFSKGGKNKPQQVEQQKSKKNSNKLKEIPIQPKGEINDPAMVRMNMDIENQKPPQPATPDPQQTNQQQALPTPPPAPIETPLQPEVKEIVTEEKKDEKEEIELL